MRGTAILALGAFVFVFALSANGKDQSQALVIARHQAVRDFEPTRARLHSCKGTPFERGIEAHYLGTLQAHTRVLEDQVHVQTLLVDNADAVESALALKSVVLGASTLVALKAGQLAGRGAWTPSKSVLDTVRALRKLGNTQAKNWKESEVRALEALFRPRAPTRGQSNFPGGEIVIGGAVAVAVAPTALDLADSVTRETTRSIGDIGRGWWDLIGGSRSTSDWQRRARGEGSIEAKLSREDIEALVKDAAIPEIEPESGAIRDRARDQALLEIERIRSDLQSKYGRAARTTPVASSAIGRLLKYPDRVSDEVSNTLALTLLEQDLNLARRELSHRSLERVLALCEEISSAQVAAFQDVALPALAENTSKASPSLLQQTRAPSMRSTENAR